MWEKLYIVAAEGTTWPLDLDTVEREFRRRFPGCVLSRRRGAASGKDYVSFDLDVDGMRHGIYVDGGNLTLSGGSPEAWADTVAWFLALLPADSSAVAVATWPFVVTVDVGATREQIRQMLDQLAIRPDQTP
jgi:hypothetical protein